MGDGSSEEAGSLLDGSSREEEKKKKKEKRGRAGRRSLSFWHCGKAPLCVTLLRCFQTATRKPPARNLLWPVGSLSPRSALLLPLVAPARAACGGQEAASVAASLLHLDPARERRDQSLSVGPYGCRWMSVQCNRVCVSAGVYCVYDCAPRDAFCVRT